MSPAMRNSVYKEVVDVFFDREIEAHLHKKPEDITKSDIAKIHEWSRLAIALLAEDEKTVEDFSESLLAIAKKNSGTK